MIEFKHTISDVHGLHARNALHLAKEVGKYSCIIQVMSQEKTANGNQVLELMSLNGRHGEVLTFILEGEEEDKAAASIKKLIQDIL